MDLHVSIGPSGGKERVYAFTLIIRDSRDFPLQHLHLAILSSSALALALTATRYLVSFKMSLSPSTPRRARTNSLISLMCELEGIVPPGPDAYTADPPEPLTEEEVGWVKKLIKEREESETVSHNQASPGVNRDGDNQKDTQRLPAMQEPQTTEQPKETEHQSTATQQPVASPEPVARPRPERSSPQRFVCPTCNRSDFSSARTFRGHVTQVHIGTRCFWPGCFARLPSEGNLNRHLQNHNSDLPDGHVKCNWPGCRKRYEWSQALYRHLREHQVAARNAHNS
ncbi:hypothetical protein K449DRAFT_465104 [Hypoxylon sp. EC38]|nr:hypothetical protein K449DRAFT_465104 [Hypoxylon sp. EC38]